MPLPLSLFHPESLEWRQAVITSEKARGKDTAALINEIFELYGQYRHSLGKELEDREAINQLQTEIKSIKTSSQPTEKSLDHLLSRMMVLKNRVKQSKLSLKTQIDVVELSVAKVGNIIRGSLFAKQQAELLNIAAELVTIRKHRDFTKEQIDILLACLTLHHQFIMLKKSGLNKYAHRKLEKAMLPLRVCQYDERNKVIHLEVLCEGDFNVSDLFYNHSLRFCIQMLNAFGKYYKVVAIPPNELPLHAAYGTSFQSASGSEIVTLYHTTDYLTRPADIRIARSSAGKILTENQSKFLHLLKMTFNCEEFKLHSDIGDARRLIESLEWSFARKPKRVIPKKTEIQYVTYLMTRNEKDLSSLKYISLDDFEEMDIWLHKHSFVAGFVHTEADTRIYHLIKFQGKEAINPIQFPNLYRWLYHMQSNEEPSS